MKTFLLLNLALGFYNVGTIWAHEVDIFRSWQHSGAAFHEIQAVHWGKLPYWVLAPAGLGLLGSIALLWYHPAGSPAWGFAGVFACQALSFILTIFMWGRWQAALSRDPLGAASPFLARILRTHWLRTGLVTLTGVLLLCWASEVL